MEIVTADIGGTHARFAIATLENGRVASLSDPVTLATADHTDLRAAWTAFMRAMGRHLPRAGAIAVAAPIHGEIVRMTNGSWTFRPDLLAEQLGLDAHILINDFAAVAYAVGAVDDNHLAHIAGPKTPLPKHGAISVVGPGTGLGVALLWRETGKTYVIPTEGGHSDFAPLDAFDDRLLAHLRARHDRVSIERVASGPGLRAIYEALARRERCEVPPGDDKALWSRALGQVDSLDTAALERFCMTLGAIAGDIALAHGPCPVVIAGGLGLRLRESLPRSGFHDRFVAKGRYRALMETQPVYLITHPEPGLYGAAAGFAQEHAQ